VSTPANVATFYDQLAPFYHLIFPDWEASIRRQAAALDALLREHWGEGRLDVLDVACGIGTQTLGLAALGHRLTASDVSAAAVERAKREAAARGLTIDFSVADMRQAAAQHRRAFDLVLACDNAVPHLLTDDDLATAFGQFFACTRPGGGCLVTVRDYDREDRSATQVRPHGIRVEGQVRYLAVQAWEFHGAVYDLSLYLIEDRGGAGCVTRVMRSRYYAVGTDRLLELMRGAGFVQVERLDDRFYQPVLLGKRPALPAATGAAGASLIRGTAGSR
jgi:SAM-dependent methyltransferase